MAWDDLPEWLRQPANPGAAFLQGAQAGTAIARTRLEAQQLQMQRAQFEQERAIMPLKMQLMQNQIDDAGLTIKTKLKMAEYDLQVKQGASELADAYTKISKLENGWANPEAGAMIGEVGVKYPALVGSPIWQHSQDNMFKAGKLQNDNLRYQIQNEYNHGRIGVSEGKLQIEKEKVELLNLRLLMEKKTPDMMNADAIKSAREQVDSAVDSGDPAQMSKARSHLETLLGLTTPTNETTEITTDESGHPVVKITRGKQGATGPAGGLTTAASTSTQKGLLSTEKALDNIAQLSQIIEANPGTIGLPGMAREAAEKIGGMLSPETQAPVTKARTNLKSTVESVVSSFKSDNQVNAHERAMLEALGPSTGWWESDSTAKAKLESLSDVLALRTLRDFKALNRPPTDNVLRNLSVESFKYSVRNGLATKEDGSRYFHLHQAK